MLEHDTAVSATLAAAGFHRAPLDDDDDDLDARGSHRIGSDMNRRSASGLAVGTASSARSGARTSAYMDSPHPDDVDNFNPYQDHVASAGAREGYVSGPPVLPHVTLSSSPYGERNGSGGGGDHPINHSASQSAGSYEPLLAAYYRAAPPPSPPPRNPLRLSDVEKSPPLISLLLNPAEDNRISSGPSQHTSDDRLDPELHHRMNGQTDRASQRDLRDEEDYSRPVLGVSASSI